MLTTLERPPQICIVGRRNVGKSSLLNSLINENFSRVSKNPGTTVQPIKKEFELIPHGPVILVDTAGIEEEGELGEKKISQTVKTLAHSNLIIVVLDAHVPLHPKEIELFAIIDKLNIKYLVVLNKIEFGTNPKLLSELKELRIVHFEISCKEKVGLEQLKRKIIRSLPVENKSAIFQDLISKGDNVLLVISEEMQSCEFKIESNQILLIKELISNEGIVVICKENELNQALKRFNKFPDLIITCNDLVTKLQSQVSNDVKITTFPLLLSINKSSIKIFLKGLLQLERLQNGDKVIISELCPNHPPNDEISISKIPWLIEHYLNKKLDFVVVKDKSLPSNLENIKLIIQCSGCSIAGFEYQYRINEANLLDIPIVNYSLLISYLKGTFPKVIMPFKEAISEWEKLKRIFV